MLKKYLLLELSYTAHCHDDNDAVLHNVYIDIAHPENLAMFSESCKNRHEINDNPAICQLITSWLRLLGIFTILDNSDQDKENPVIVHLADGGTLSIDGWEILDQEAKDKKLALMEIEPDEEDEESPTLFAHEYSDSVALTKAKTQVANSVYVATRNSYSNNFDLVLECILNPEKKYSLYQGLYDGSNVQVILNDLALLPSCKPHESVLAEEYVTCNILNLFKNAIDAYDADSEFIDSFVQLDITPYADSSILMDYIELQFAYQSNNLIAFFGNDPCS